MHNGPDAQADEAGDGAGKRQKARAGQDEAAPADDRTHGQGPCLHGDNGFFQFIALRAVMMFLMHTTSRKRELKITR